MSGSDGDVGVLHARVGAFDDHLFQVAVPGPDEGHGEVSSAGGSYSCQMRVKGQDGFLHHWQFSAQWRIYVQTAEIFTNLCEFGVDASKARGNKVKSA